MEYSFKRYTGTKPGDYTIPKPDIQPMGKVLLLKLCSDHANAKTRKSDKRRDYNAAYVLEYSTETKEKGLLFLH